MFQKRSNRNDRFARNCHVPTYRPDFENLLIGFVAQCIKHWPLEPGIVGSSPTKVMVFSSSWCFRKASQRCSRFFLYWLRSRKHVRQAWLWLGGLGAGAHAMASGSIPSGACWFFILSIFVFASHTCIELRDAEKKRTFTCLYVLPHFSRYKTADIRILFASHKTQPLRHAINQTLLLFSERHLLPKEKVKHRHSPELIETANL